jgi:hypothetical protein
LVSLFRGPPTGIGLNSPPPVADDEITMTLHEVTTLPLNPTISIFVVVVLLDVFGMNAPAMGMNAAGLTDVLVWLY